MNHSSLNLSDSLLTPADLVGRSCRIARLRWYELIRIFVLPAFIYSLAFSIIGSSQLIAGSIATYSIVCLSCLLVMIAAKLELCVLEYAVIMLFTDREEDLTQAIKNARKKSAYIFVLNVPTLSVDAFVLILAALSVWLLSQGGSHTMQMVIGLVVYTLLLLLSIPFMCAELLNLAFIATLVAENLTLSGCLKRFTYLLTQHAGYVSGFLLLFAIMAFMLEVATALSSLLDMPMDLLHGVARDVWKVFVEFIGALISTPLYAFLSAASAIGVVALHDQLTMRIEGTDIIKKIAANNQSQSSG